MAFTDAETGIAPVTPRQLKAERLNRGYSIRAFADELGIPEQSIRRLERGLGISPANAKKVADFYDVLVTDLMPIEDEAI